MTGNIHVLKESNYRQVVPTLRNIIEQIENGEFGEVGSAAFVLLGDKMEVFGMGPDSEAPSIALLLHSGFLRLSKSVEEHGS